MKSAITLALLAATITGTSQATERTLGIGVNMNDTQTIYLPINMGNLLVEPTLSINSYNIDNTGPVSDNSRVKSTQVGVGVFKNEPVTKETYLYYGMRAGYTKGHL